MLQLIAMKMVSGIKFREATDQDIQVIAILHPQKGVSNWFERIHGYKNCDFNPYQALPHRVFYVATASNSIVGFIAGHLTNRSDYFGQIQWLSVLPEFRRNGIASELLSILASWFVKHGSLSVSVDVDPDNKDFQSFYKSRHAESLNNYWLYWDDIRVALLKQQDQVI